MGTTQERLGLTDADVPDGRLHVKAEPPRVLTSVSEGDLNAGLGVPAGGENSAFAQVRGSFRVVAIPAGRADFGPFPRILMTR